MKARIKQVFHVGEYEEMRLSEFVREFPQLVPMVSQMSGIDIVQAIKYCVALALILVAVWMLSERW